MALPTTYNYNGEEKTLSELFQLSTLNISERALRSRLKKMDAYKAIHEKTRHFDSEKIDKSWKKRNGQFVSLRDANAMAKLNGINLSNATIAQRRDQGWTLMRTTSTPTKPGPKKFDPSYINTIPWILNGKVIFSRK